ncbi:MAG: hypothetical protein LBL59_07430 [Xanthomonadaceae bacterium]|nr:hypothetical protein [Xanthomonadaceae bacterium]
MTEAHHPLKPALLMAGSAVFFSLMALSIRLASEMVVARRAAAEQSSRSALKPSETRISN